MEEFLRNRTILEPTRLELLEKYLPESWKHYYENYGMTVVGDCDRPPMTIVPDIGLMKFRDSDGNIFTGDVDLIY